MATLKSTRNHWSVTHGDSFVGRRTAEYRVWNNITQRCHNPKHTHFNFYGGRGIIVCDRWRNSFENFLADMGRRPSSKHTIDRIDTNGNYEPGNCQWATMKEQSRNTRRNRLLTHNGKTMCVSAWAEFLGVNRQLLKWRLDAGWSVDLALSTPKVDQSKKTCTEEGCGRPCHGGGLCYRHYLRAYRLRKAN